MTEPRGMLLDEPLSALDPSCGCRCRRSEGRRNFGHLHPPTGNWKRRGGAGRHHGGDEQAMSRPARRARCTTIRANSWRAMGGHNVFDRRRLVARNGHRSAPAGARTPDRSATTRRAHQATTAAGPRSRGAPWNTAAYGRRPRRTQEPEATRKESVRALASRRRMWTRLPHPATAVNSGRRRAPTAGALIRWCSSAMALEEPGANATSRPAGKPPPKRDRPCPRKKNPTAAPAEAPHRQVHRRASPLRRPCPAIHAQEKIVLRYLGTAVNQDKAIAEEVQGRHRHRDPVRGRHHRRRHQASRDRAQQLRPDRHRVLLAQEDRADRQPEGHRHQAREERRQDHLALHQGRSRGQEGRRPGHGADQGDLPRGREEQGLREAGRRSSCR